MKRILEPEWLDELPPEDPRAIHSRRDLVRLNGAMGNARIRRRLLANALAERKPNRVVEMGGGDGALLLQLARDLAGQWPGVEAVMVDFKAAVSQETREEFEKLGWSLRVVTADIFDWLKEPVMADVMLANLFLHHFTDERLRELFRLVAARTGVFIACEPRRAQVPLLFSRMVGLIGCNAVTRHDAVISVRAGFGGRELSALWPETAGWELREEGAGWFGHAFLAGRGTS